MRYVLLLKVARLFDDDLLQAAWAARIERSDEQAEATVTTICQELITRLSYLPDARSREILEAALDWAARNPEKLRYNAKSKEEAVAVAPNAVGFQSVILGIAERLKRTPAKRVSITVDRQSQFNKAQTFTAQWYQRAKAAQMPIGLGPGMPSSDMKDIPNCPLRFASTYESVGLELTDLYLWIFKRQLEGREIAPEPYEVIRRQLHRGRTDEISVEAISRRWARWFDELPNPTPDQMAAGQRLRLEFEAARQKALAAVDADEKATE
jgi:hypothetical protein